MKKTGAFLFLALLISSVAFARAAGDGRQVVATAGTAVQLDAASTYTTYINICAETDNTGTISIGSNTVVAALATRRGIPLSAGNCYPLYNVRLNEIYIDSTVSTDGVTYHWMDVWAN